MTGPGPAARLRVSIHAIPAVRAAVEEALTELRPHLRVLQTDALISEPWMGDATSKFVHADYRQRVIEASDGPLTAIRAYEVELTRILDSLTAMEEQYLSTEAEIARGLGRQA